MLILIFLIDLFFLKWKISKVLDKPFPGCVCRVLHIAYIGKDQHPHKEPKRNYDNMFFIKPRL